MPATWYAYDIFYRDLDRLVLAAVRPLDVDAWPGVEQCFWLRGYAGGPHIKLCLRAEAAAVDMIERRLRAAVEAYLDAHPMDPLDDYNPDRARAILRMDGEDPEVYDLTYRNNEMRCGSYNPPIDRLPSRAAVTLTESFYTDCREAAYAVLESHDKRLSALRIFFLRSLLFGGAYQKGAASFRSHWERFRVEWPRAVTQPVEQQYAQQREAVESVMLDVLALWREDRLDEDPVLRHWATLHLNYQQTVRRLVQQGVVLVANRAPRAYLERGRQKMKSAEIDSPFLETFFEDAEAFEQMVQSPGFIMARVTVNLIYLFLPLVGISALERFSLGYFAYQAIEDHYGYDLTDRLRETMTQTTGS